MNDYYSEKLNKNKRNNKFDNRLLSLFFTPSAYKKDVSKIDINQLKKEGIKLIVCDIDNTLSQGYSREISPHAQKFIDDVKKAKIKIILFSNNKEKRVKFFGDLFEVAYFSKAFKPFRTKFKKAILKKEKLHLDEIIIVGNQILTDILLANALGIRSILVSPIMPNEKKLIAKVYRLVEKYIYKRITINNLLDLDK